MPKRKFYNPEVKKLMLEIEELKSIVKAKKKLIKEISDKTISSKLVNEIDARTIKLTFE